MRLQNIILALGLGFVNIADAAPAPTEASAPPAAFQTGYIAPPPGVDLIKHQTPPKGYKKSDAVVAVSPNSTIPDGLDKRQAGAYAYFYLCDNWYYGGQCDTYTITPNGNLFLFSAWGNMNDRTSSFRIYTDGWPAKTCVLYTDYYFDGSGNLVCYGSYWWQQITPPSGWNVDVVQHPENDNFSCAKCWVS